MNLPTPLTDRLGWTLLHSLWQGAAIALLATLLLRALKSRSANTRYLLATLSLLTLFAAAIITFSLPRPLQSTNPVLTSTIPPHLAPPPANPAPLESNPLTFAPSPLITPAPLTPPIPSPTPFRLPSLFPTLVPLWTLGVLALTLYHAGGWLAAQRLRSLRTTPAHPALHATLGRLAARFNLPHIPTLRHSPLIASPLTLGHFRPLILLPASLLTNLPPDHLEALLAHELAHIRRHDYLINLLQTLIETLFFYHPAVWFLSRQIRLERELCCDDLASLTTNPLTYADALLHLAQLPTPPFTLAANGPTLLPRIQRLLGKSSTRPTPLPATLACLALITLPLLLTLPHAHAQAPTAPAPPKPPASILLHGKFLLPDGSPAKDLPVAAQTVDNANHQIPYSPATTAADGSFSLTLRTPGATLDLYALAPDHKSAFFSSHPTDPLAPTQDLGTLTLQPALTPDILLLDSLGKPLASTDINVQPTFGDNGLGNMTRLFSTDPAGHLHPDGILPNLQYKLNHPGKPAIIALLATPTPQTKPLQLTLDTRLKIRILDADKKSIPLKSLSELNVQMPDGAKWILGPDPVILDKADDNAVLIDRDLVGSNHVKGTLVTLYFRSTDDVAHVATTLYPGPTDTLLFALQQPANPAFTLNHEDREVPPDAFAGRLLDAANKPIAGAAISAHDYRSPTDDMKTLATTDAAGDFLLPPNTLDAIYIQIDKPGFARNWLISRDLPKGHPFDVHLDNTTRLQLDLKRPDGSPAAGAQLTAWATINASYMEWKFSAFPTTATADAAGHIDTLIDPRTNELKISDRDLNFAHLTDFEIPAGKTTTKSLTLAPGIHLHARFIDSVTGQPVPNVKLALIDFTVLWQSEHPGSQRITSPDGLADWPAVMPGRRHLSVSADGYARLICPENLDQSHRGIDGLWLDISPALPDLTVRLEKAMRISGTVRDPDGRPVPNATVNIKNLQTGDERYARQTDAAGHFLLQVPATPDPAGTGVTQFALALMREPGTPVLFTSEPFPAKASAEKHLDLTYPAAAPLPPPPPAPASQPAPKTTGQVLSPTNTPVPNATVMLLGKPGSDQALIASTTTSPTGQFSLPSAPDTPEITAFLANVGFAPPVYSADDFPLRLAPAIDCQVSLQLPDGSPAANIPLRPTLILFPDPASPIGIPLFLPDEISKQLAVTTDPAGHALFHGLPKNATVRFDIDDPRFAHIPPMSQSPLEGDPTLIHITLPKLAPASSISGTLLTPDTHQPLANAAIHAHAITPGADVATGEATTDAAGHFTLSRLRPTAYTLYLADVEPWLAPNLVINLAAGQNASADFQLSHGVLLRGQILDPTTRQPIPDVQLGVDGDNFGATSDGDGRFQIHALPGILHPYIRSAPDGYLNTPADPVKDISLAENQSADITLTLTPDPAPLIEGIVLGPDDKPVAHATIAPQLRDAFTHTYATDASGHFHLHAYTGTLLRARLNDLATTAPVSIVEGQPLTLHLQKNATFALTLSILDESHHPVPNASFEVESDYGDFSESDAAHHPDPTGAAHLDALPVDRDYRISAFAPGFGLTSEKLPKPTPGAALSASLTLHPATSLIAGTVLNPDATPAPGITVTLNSSGSGYLQTQTDATGHFSFPVTDTTFGDLFIDLPSTTTPLARRAKAGDTALHLTLTAPTPVPK